VVDVHDASVRMVYRVMLITQDGERIPIRAKNDIERSGKERAAAAIRAFLGQHAV
jgi:hypothetical protein